VRIIGRNGKETFDQVPLTLDDVLFPQEGDFIADSNGHNDDLDYLYALFRHRLRDDRTALVLRKHRVDWGLLGVRPICADIPVFLGLKRYHDRATFDVANTEARPALVIEVTNPLTRQNDRGPKFNYYYRAGVPIYLIADVPEQDDDRRIVLVGYRHTPAGYEPIVADSQGRIFLEPVRCSLGVTLNSWGTYHCLACFDPATGEKIPDYVEMATALERIQKEILGTETDAGH
jgi:colicin import membrane protein